MTVDRGASSENEMVEIWPVFHANVDEVVATTSARGCMLIDDSHDSSCVVTSDAHEWTNEITTRR
jgi:hypothetical protein